MEQLDELVRYYENEGQEELRLHPDSLQHLELEVAQKYLAQYLPAPVRVLDSCAGTGVYAYWLAGRGHRVVAGDIVSHNVEKMRKNKAEAALLEDIYEGDATDLSRFADESFDAVLCMGALYHMQAPESRRAALAESLRVLRSGGLLFATYMNRYAVILNNLQPDMDNIAEVLRFATLGREGIYYASTAGEMEALVRQVGFAPCCHLALDGPACFLVETAKLLTPQGFARWKEYHFAVCEEQSLIGSSYHNMIIAKKE